MEFISYIYNNPLEATLLPLIVLILIFAAAQKFLNDISPAPDPGDPDGEVEQIPFPLSTLEYLMTIESVIQRVVVVILRFLKKSLEGLCYLVGIRWSYVVKVVKKCFGVLIGRDDPDLDDDDISPDDSFSQMSLETHSLGDVLRDSVRTDLTRMTSGGTQEAGDGSCQMVLRNGKVLDAPTFLSSTSPVRHHGVGDAQRSAATNVQDESNAEDSSSSISRPAISNPSRGLAKSAPADRNAVYESTVFKTPRIPPRPPTTCRTARISRQPTASSPPEPSSDRNGGRSRQEREANAPETMRPFGLMKTLLQGGHIPASVIQWKSMGFFSRDSAVATSPTITG